jgi:hypothetical protein
LTEQHPDNNDDINDDDDRYARHWQIQVEQFDWKVDVEFIIRAFSILSIIILLPNNK